MTYCRQGHTLIDNEEVLPGISWVGGDLTGFPGD